MKKNPSSIERNENENKKENEMNAAKKYRITDCLTDLQEDDLDALVEKATANRFHGKLTIWRWNGSQWKYVRRFVF